MDRKRKKKRTGICRLCRPGAYMTVEASVIVPAVFILGIMILYLMFFMYDRCLMTQDLYTAAYRRSIERGQNKGAAGGGAKGSTQIDESRYFFLSNCTCSVQGGSNIEASGNAAMSVPGTAGERRWQFRVCMRARKTDPPQSFRKYRRIRAIAAQLAITGASGGE